MICYMTAGPCDRCADAKHKGSGPDLLSSVICAPSIHSGSDSGAASTVTSSSCRDINRVYEHDSSAAHAPNIDMAPAMESTAALVPKIVRGGVSMRICRSCLHDRSSTTCGVPSL